MSDVIQQRLPRRHSIQSARATLRANDADESEQKTYSAETVNPINPAPIVRFSTRSRSVDIRGRCRVPQVEIVHQSRRTLRRRDDGLAATITLRAKSLGSVGVAGKISPRTAQQVRSERAFRADSTESGRGEEGLRAPSGRAVVKASECGKQQPSEGYK